MATLRNPIAGIPQQGGLPDVRTISKGGPVTVGPLADQAAPPVSLDRSQVDPNADRNPQQLPLAGFNQNAESPRERAPELPRMTLGGGDGLSSASQPQPTAAMPTSPMPAAAQGPSIFHPMPAPEPQQLLSAGGANGRGAPLGAGGSMGGSHLFGSQGGLLGGGLGVPGKMGSSTPNPSPLLALLASLLGGR